MARRTRATALRWLLAPALAISISTPGLAQNNVSRLLYKPYATVRAALIREGYRPLTQVKDVDDDACGYLDLCNKWPEVVTCDGSPVYTCIFVFAPPHRPRSRRPFVVVAAPETRWEVFRIGLANRDDRAAVETSTTLAKLGPIWITGQPRDKQPLSEVFAPYELGPALPPSVR